MAIATAKKKTTKKTASKAKDDGKVVGTTTAKTKKVTAVWDVEVKQAHFRITGTTPMIMARWTEKALRQMLEKQTKGGRTTKRENRVPEEDYKALFYVIKGKPAEPGTTYGIPAIWIKQAIIDACAFTGRQIYKTTARGALYVPGTRVKGEPFDLLPIVDHTEPHMREDTVRNANGIADIRFRPQFDEWAVEFSVHYDENVMSVDQIANLIQRAGFSIGLGEWRPAKSGDFGRFAIDAG